MIFKRITLTKVVKNKKDYILRKPVITVRFPNPDEIM